MQKIRQSRVLQAKSLHLRNHSLLSYSLLERGNSGNDHSLTSSSHRLQYPYSQLEPVRLSRWISISLPVHSQLAYHQCPGKLQLLSVRDCVQYTSVLLPVPGWILAHDYVHADFNTDVDSVGYGKVHGHSASLYL